ncbi:hypothetical protein DC345_01555 [Paenibacillus taichungensis]|uniref:Uncharacterized protein n=1 Tax=Paenibacillus taichungensis TaxID=484184 RepID=A0A329R433_9BACL|nr:hypothetical protein DC345_01555 [Paenibacillus taichungensis]
MIRGKDNDRIMFSHIMFYLKRFASCESFFLFHKKNIRLLAFLTVIEKTPIFSFRDKETGEASSGRIHCFERSEEEGKV